MRELMFTRLRKSQHFPQLISVDKTNLIIEMNYCGCRLSLQENNSHFIPQIKPIVDTLKNKQILLPYCSNPSNSDENLLHLARLWSSLLAKDGRLHFIDFETCISFPLMETKILTKNLVGSCQNCNYDYLASTMESYLKGENNEMLRNYLINKDIHYLDSLK